MRKSFTLFLFLLCIVDWALGAKSRWHVRLIKNLTKRLFD